MTFVPTVPHSYPAWDPEYYVDVVRFAPQNARYWRIHIDNVANTSGYATNGTAASTTPHFVGIQEMELHDSAPTLALGDAKARPNESPVALAGQRVTAIAGGGIPANTFYVESADRSSGIRVDASGAGVAPALGDAVDISGVIKTNDDGEQYILAEFVAIRQNAVTLDALGMNNRAATDKSARGLFVKLWGKVSDVANDSFVITDGSDTHIKVHCGDLAKPANGAKIKVRGVVSAKNGVPVLLMRNEPAGWFDASQTYQPLPFSSKHGYVTDWLVVGPFPGTDINHDYMLDASGVAETEVRPTVGMACGDKTWARLNTGEQLKFTNLYTTSNTNCTFYAHCWIYSPIAQDLGCRVGSDDGFKLFINGYSYSQFDSPGRPDSWGEDWGETWGEAFQPGLTSVMMKVTNFSDGSSFDLVFTPTGNYGSPGYGLANAKPGLGYVLAK